MRRAVLLSAVIALVACAKEEAPAAAKALNCAASEDGKVEASDAWVREQGDAAGASAAYFTLCNASTAPATLTGLSTGIAGRTELHESTRDANGVVQMSPLGVLTLAPGERVIFEPGGKHAMLLDLVAAIGADDAATLTFQFADGSTLDIVAPSRSLTEAVSHEGH
jgi:hypothetical protein